MQLAKIVFPGWSAAATLVGAHGADAAGFVRDAATAPDGASRLDAAVRAMTSFDHVQDNARALPVQWVLPQVKAAYKGYDMASTAVSLILRSGIVPGARERVGRQQLLAARDAFRMGVDVAAADRSRFGGALAGGWMAATIEDAIAATKLLRADETAERALLAGLGTLDKAVRARRGVDEALVRTVADRFAALGAAADRLVDEATRAAQDGRTPTTVRPGDFEESARLLDELATVVG